MRTVVRDEQAGFAGGLNLVAEESALLANEVRSATNGRLDMHGAIRKRFGTKRVHATAITGGAANLIGGYSYRQSSGAVTELVVVNAGAVYSGTYGIPMTWSLVGSLTNGSYPSFAHFRDASAECVYIADAGGSVFLMSKFKAGVLTSPAGTPPGLNRLAVQNQRLFGITGYDQTLWYSALNDGDTLGIDASGGGSQVVRTFGNQNITALVALGSSLLMFHKTGISKFTGFGADDISIASGTRGLSQDTGTICPDSIVVVENVCYFLADRGWYEATEFAVKPISEKVEPIVPDFFSATSLGVKAVHSRTTQEVYWSIPGQGIYVYNYRLKAWSGPFTGIFTSSVPYALWETLDSSGKPIILSGHSDGFVRRVDLPSTYKDDVLSDGTGGSAFTFTCRCHRMYFGNPLSEKALRYIMVQTDRDSTNSVVTFDMEVVSGGTGNLAAIASQRAQRVQAWGRGQHLDITLSDAGGTAAPVFSRVIAHGVDYGERF